MKFDAIPPIELPQGQKCYFASDFHFGIPNLTESIARERRVCAWLDSIQHDAHTLFLLGDLFDTWMEYKRVVPRGFTRFLGKLASLSDAGVHIVVFTGNHDLWMTTYFEQELGATVYKQHKTLKINGKSLFIGHGDGISHLEKSYKRLKYILHHPLCQYLYRCLHPDWGIAIADYFSRLGPKHKYANLAMQTDEKEAQIDFAKQMLQHTHFDYFVFGHRHIPLSKELDNGAYLVNLGDWISHDTYAVFDSQELVLKKY